MHQTLAKFGYPGTVLAEFSHWCVLLRPQQATLGALVIAAKSEATAFSTLPPEAFTELSGVIGATETALRAVCGYDKINYLMLMMVDPQVHFHVLPRYAGAKSFEGVSFTDPAWPGPPDLKHANDLDAGTRGKLMAALIAAFGARKF
jgi:diadenosine tetraphosphate (Ap4A) HIT family hydrolase